MSSPGSAWPNDQHPFGSPAVASQEVTRGFALPVLRPVCPFEDVRLHSHGKLTACDTGELRNKSSLTAAVRTAC